MLLATPFMFHRLLHSLGQALARYLSQPHASIQTGMPTARTALAQCLRPGDVLLIEGNSRVSSVIKYFTQSTWSHAAFYIGPQLGGCNALGEPYLFIEADMLDGVCKRSLSHYQTYPTRICRPVGLNAADLQRVLERVSSMLGAQYDLRNVFDLARYFLPALPVYGQWRRRLLAMGSGDPTRAICSSLIAEAFQSVGYPVLPAITAECHQDAERLHAVMETIYHIRNRRLFVPRDFDVSPYFEIVKPTLAEDFDFHRMHWEAESTPLAAQAPSSADSASRRSI
ncbi:MAG: lipo-like protein [Giesbergeria sp.]